MLNEQRCIVCGRSFSTGLSVMGCLICFPCEQLLVKPLGGEKIPEEKRPKCEIIPGLTAANTAAAALGAPLMHDYAVISLSDLMTPWEQIQKRASLAAEGDFVIAIYNPKSRGRTTYLDQIRNIVLQFRKPGTPVGIVRKAGRPGMNWTISTLEKLPEEDVDMQSTVIIGNSNSYIADGHIITPRGYKL